MEQSFVDLVVQAQKGDPKANNKLLKQCMQHLEKYVRRYSVPYEDFEDIMQETLINIYQKLSQLIYPQSFQHWINKIFRREVYRYLKKEKKHKRYRPSNDSPDTSEKERWHSSSSHSWEDLPARVKEPVDEAIEAEEAERIHRGIEQLPSPLRDVVTAHYLHDQPIAEISRRLGKPEGTIKRWLYEARQMLQESLQFFLNI